VAAGSILQKELRSPVLGLQSSGATSRMKNQPTLFQWTNINSAVYLSLIVHANSVFI